MTTREKILASARNEFSDRGFDGSRVDRLAEAAGVNKAMIYYYFGSKEALYRAVLDDLLGRLGAFLGRVMSENDDLEDVLSRTSGFMAEFFESSEDLVPIVLREMAGGGDRMRDVFEKIVRDAGAPKKFRELLAGRVQNGLARPVEPEQTFISFLGMNLFYLFFSPVLNSVWEIKDEEAFRRSRADAVVDLFLNGINTR